MFFFSGEILVLICTGGTDSMGWNFGMLFTGFKVSKGSTHGAWRWDVMIPPGREGMGKGHFQRPGQCTRPVEESVSLYDMV